MHAVKDGKKIINQEQKLVKVKSTSFLYVFGREVSLIQSLNDVFEEVKLKHRVPFFLCFEEQTQCDSDKNGVFLQNRSRALDDFEDFLFKLSRFFKFSHIANIGEEERNKFKVLH